MTVPFYDLGAEHQQLKTQLDDCYSRVLASGSYILGAETVNFERRFADYCGAQYCLGVGNGLDALHLILRGMAIGAGDEVIVPSHTFIASWLAVSFAGATPVPVDVCNDTFNMDPARIEAAITF